MKGKDKVASAWRRGEWESSSNLSTDGETVHSYGHVIGITRTLSKIAYDCHYSRTTAGHCSALKKVAGRTLDGCPSCGDTGLLDGEPAPTPQEQQPNGVHIMKD
jgi:hypothetical protein